MPASKQQQEHAVERAGKIYTILKRAAEMGEQCPENKVLRERFNCSDGAVNSSLSFLEAAGMIEVERMATSRIITICATGVKTAGKPGKAHWSAKAGRRAA